LPAAFFHPALGFVVIERPEPRQAVKPLFAGADATMTKAAWPRAIGML
jgi:hypothetical protein